MADIRDFLEALRDQGIGLRDAASTVGTGALLAPFKGLYGLGKAAATGSLSEGAKAIEDTRGVGETPKTEEGTKYLTDLGEGLERVGKLARPITVPYEQWAMRHPELAVTGEAALSLLPVGRVREAAMQGVKGAVKAAAPLTREAVLAASLRRDAPPLSNAPRMRAVAASRVRTEPELPEPHTVPTLRQSIEAAAREREPQLDLPGMEPTLTERSQNAETALQAAQAQVRREGLPPEYTTDFSQGELLGRSAVPTRRRPPADVSPESIDQLTRALRSENQANYDEMRAHVDDLRRQRRPDETLEDALDREYQVLSGKHTLAELVPKLDRPHEEFVDAITAPDVQQGKVNRLADAQRAQASIDEDRAYRPLPDWATQLTVDPRYQRDMPRGVPEPLETGRSPGASESWWTKQFPPPDPRATVKAFLQEIRSQPEAFQYGPEPPRSVRSLEDFARHFGEQAGTPIGVDWTGGGVTETEKLHRPGDFMRDRYGDWKYSDMAKEHGRGDYPVYDEDGNVKMVKTGGLDEYGGKEMEKYVARGGELKRDEYGDPIYPKAEAEGGEEVRDPHGRVVMKEVDDDASGEGFTLTARDPETGRTGYIETENWPEAPTTNAMSAGGHGALLYQTQLGHAAREGVTFPAQSNLSPANQLRLLSNTLANDARMGRNPRHLAGTKSGDRPPAQERYSDTPAEGPEIWRALTGEAEHRLAQHAPDAPRIEFTPEGFTAGGVPITAADIRNNLRTYSPHFDYDPKDWSVRKGQVTQETLMQSALYRWLEQADPEEARKVAGNWKKYGAPLFGLGGVGLLADQMRADAQPAD